MQDSGHLVLDHYRQAAKYDTATGSNYKGLSTPAVPGIHEEVAKAAKRELSPDADVLDIGCASGALCLRLHELGFNMTGCDLVPENFRLRETMPFVKVNLKSSFFPKIRQKIRCDHGHRNHRTCGKFPTFFAPVLRIAGARRHFNLQVPRISTAAWLAPFG